MEPVLPFAIDLPRAGRRRTHALHRTLRAAIVDGRLPAGYVLPATRRLASELGVARNTVVAAYDLLLAEGFLAPRSGRVRRSPSLGDPRRDHGTPRLARRARGSDRSGARPGQRRAPRPTSPHGAFDWASRITGNSRTLCGADSRHACSGRTQGPHSGIRRLRACRVCAQRSRSTWHSPAP